jgi:VWFA-related protein
MRAPRPLHGPIFHSARPLALLFAALMILARLPTQLSAQEGEPPPPGTPMYTLHVYTNLVQLPTLVLNDDLKPLPLLNKDQFTLSLDGGPVFRPTQIHLEGDDPIVMAIMLDASGTEDDLIRKAPAAIASLSSHALTPHDRVALFAFDCSIVAYPKLLDPDPVKLRAALDDLLKTTGLHGPKSSRANCYHNAQVWNFMTVVVNALTKFSGRRAIVAITDGFDKNSKVSRADLQQFAVNFSATIFDIDSNNRVHNPIETLAIHNANADLQILTSGTGGLVFPTSSDDFASTLQRIVALLRSRYIIEFPRPSNSTVGTHIVEVKVPKRNAVIRSAGVSVPMPGDKELHDPDNVPSDPTRTPTQGNRKPPTHPH